MVQHLNLQDRSGPDEILGDLDIGLGGGGIAAGMVVGQNDGGGVLADGFAKHLPRMDEQGVQGSIGDLVYVDQAAPGVEQDDMKGLRLPEGDMITQEGCNGLWRIEWRGVDLEFASHLSGEGEGGKECHCLVPSNALHGAQFIKRCVRQLAQGAEFVEHLLRNLHHIGPLQPGAQEDRHELRIAQRVRPLACQSLAGTPTLRLVFQPVAFEHDY